MNQKAIVIGITKDWLFAAGTMLVSLKKHNSLVDCDIIVLGSNLTQKEISKLKKVHPIKYMSYDDRKVRNSHKFHRVSKMAFSRYECFNLIKKYQKVIWIDADVLIQGSINQLLNLNDKDIYLYRHQNIPASVSFSKVVKGYDLTMDCYNSGIMVLTHRVNKYKDISNWCIDQTNLHAEKINSDQAIVNMMVQKFNMRIGNLEEKYNCPPHKESINSIIIHPWGEKKFWNGINNVKWNEHNLKWRFITNEISYIKLLILNFFNHLTALKNS